jgi:hypothetical protein
VNYSHKHKFVWYAPPKVASRSTAEVFRKYCDLNPHLPKPDNPRMIFTHENEWPEDCPKDYLHIVSVRHPYYRWISYWKHDQVDRTMLVAGTLDPLDAMKKSNGDIFNGIEQWRIINNQSPGINYFIRAESWSDDIKNLPFISSNVAIENVNRGRLIIPIGTTWDEDELRELCYINFKNDYENLGYGKWDNYDHIWDCKPKPNTHALSEQTTNVSSQSQKSPFPRKI